MTEGDRHPYVGDIIYSRNASLGSAAYIETDQAFAMGQDVVLIKSFDQNQLFLSYALNSYLGMSQVELVCTGSTFKRINVGQIRELEIVVPPLPEQRAIATFLDEKTSQIDQIIEKSKAQIEKLKEYRQALITAAVTGKIDLSGLERGADLSTTNEGQQLSLFGESEGA